MATAKKKPAAKAPVQADVYQYGPYEVGAEVSTPRGVVGVPRGTVLLVDLNAVTNPFTVEDSDDDAGVFFQAPEQANIPVTTPSKMFAGGEQILSEDGADAAYIAQLQQELKVALDKVAAYEAKAAANGETA